MLYLGTSAYKPGMWSFPSRMSCGECCFSCWDCLLCAIVMHTDCFRGRFSKLLVSRGCLGGAAFILMSHKMGKASRKPPVCFCSWRNIDSPCSWRGLVGSPQPPHSPSPPPTLGVTGQPGQGWHMENWCPVDSWKCRTPGWGKENRSWTMQPPAFWLFHWVYTPTTLSPHVSAPALTSWSLALRTEPHTCLVSVCC